jgi:hypothetical protein
MSVVSPKVAIVSLGMSCQTTWQIQSNARLLVELLRIAEPVAQGGMPFDWLISPPAAVASMLAARRLFPERTEELQLNFAPWWPAHNVYYWHDFKLPEGGYELSAGFQQATAKYQYLLNKFAGLAGVERRIFIIANTQNNLNQVARATGTINAGLAAADIIDLCAATDRFFAVPSEYIVVSYADRLDKAIDRKNVKTYHLATDTSEWQGDIGQWASMFRDYFC